MRPAPTFVHGQVSATEACDQAGITYRQLDWWIRKGSIPASSSMRSPGSGNYRSVPAWYVPRLRLLGRIQEELRRSASSPNAGSCGPFMRLVFDNYTAGRISFGDFALVWEPDPSGQCLTE